MLFKFALVCLLYILLSNMICNDSKEVILTCDIENKNNSINSHDIDIDIENGLYYEENLDTLYKSIHNNKKNNLISIISNVSYMSYNFFKNVKEVIYKKVNYLCPSNKKLK